MIKIIPYIKNSCGLSTGILQFHLTEKDYVLRFTA
jgi:hypothetical protein